jgi:MerR family copper efflux transcriptional regulator
MAKPVTNPETNRAKPVTRPDPVPLRIGALAKRSGLRVETIRFYEKEGLLEPPRRTQSGYRQYSEEDALRLAFVRRAKDLGFPLVEIRDLLALSKAKGKRRDVKRVAQHRLDQVEDKIADLERMRDALRDLVGRCSGRGSTLGCPIIQTLSRGNGDVSA